MFGVAKISVMLLIYFALISCSYSLHIIENNDEYINVGQVQTILYKTNTYSITNFRLENGKEKKLMGFSMSTLKSLKEKEFTGCYLDQKYLDDSAEKVVFLTMDFTNNQIQINCSSSWDSLFIYEDSAVKKPGTSFKPLKLTRVKSDAIYSYYNFQFSIKYSMDNRSYDVYFHNCDGEKISFDLEYKLDDFYSGSPPRYDWLSIIIALISGCCFFMLGLYWVYHYKTSQYTLMSFHYILPIIVFLKAFLFILIIVKMHTIDFVVERKQRPLITVPLIYIDKCLIFCCNITLAVQGWIYVKNIFGLIERYILMSILSIQAILWSIFFSIYEFQEAENYWLIGLFKFDFVYAQSFEWILLPVVFVYVLIRKSWRLKTAVGNLEKFELFRFVCLLIAFFFYFIPSCVFIMSLTDFYEEDDVLLNQKDISLFLFFAILFYKVRPNILNESSTLETGALRTEGGVVTSVC